jgi:hypothetical protein
MMKADHDRETHIGTDPATESELQALKPWSPPAVTHLSAGLAESGANPNFDGVEGTS